MSDSIIDVSPIPAHVAIIMDGNGRWASARHLPRFAGHKAGVNAVTASVRLCAQAGVKVLTLFAFSSENWGRPEEEVSLLMGLFINALRHEIKEIHAENVRALWWAQSRERLQQPVKSA